VIVRAFLWIVLPTDSAAFHISPNNATIIAQSKKTVA